jgi:outer membrane receptor protein involved in Fe transport
MKKILTLLFIITLEVTINAENSVGSNLTGKIYDSNSSEPLKFANIVIFSSTDSSQISGTVANDSGQFELKSLPLGNYYVKASFIGYESRIVDNIKLDDPGKTLDIGEISLIPDVYDFNDVVISAERAPISYDIDKKVINVEKQFSAAGGTAVDVLENVPSVTVDIEGNVSLRGSGNFQVLIDGRPSLLDANDVLQQTPASSIKNIEIITNPSAKFESEGAAGVINLVMKKKENKGLSAMLELDGGLNDKYSGNLISEYKTNLALFNLGVDYRDQVYLWDRTNENRTTINGFNSFINSNGDGTWVRKSFGLNGGATFFVSQNSTLIFGARYNDGGFESTSSDNFFSFSDANLIGDRYRSSMSRERKGDRYSINTTFEQKFNGENHKLIADFQFNRRNGNESTINRLIDDSANNNGVFDIVSAQESKETGPSNSIRAKIDYTLPFAEKDKLEFGAQSNFDNSDDVSSLSEYDVSLNVFVFQPQFSNSVNYIKDIHALYSSYSGNIGNLGYQAGLRSEYTFRKIELINTGEDYTLNRWDYFPSAYLSYKLGGGNQIMASYTKRINRPRGWNLEPFETFMDAYNVRSGNPSLKPEYIDSYELGYQTMLGRNIVSVEAYYKAKDNKIERVRTAYDDNVTLQTSENVGQDLFLW